MNQMRKIVLLFVLIGALVACTEALFYDKVYSFDNKEWTQRVKPSFVVDIKEDDKEYVFTITLRTTTDYKYSDLWIYMNTITPDGKKVREPFKILITNPDGSWAGIKTGTIVQNQLQFGKSKLPMKGKYTFILEQGITNSKIDEVLDIGVSVKRFNVEE
jgi:gliding motility-associated lipoprotein GldH